MFSSSESDKHTVSILTEPEIKFTGEEMFVINKLVSQQPQPNYQNDWDGSSYIGGFGGENTLPNGVYFYLLQLDNEEPIRGYIYLKNE